MADVLGGEAGVDRDVALLLPSALKKHKLTGDTSVMTYRGHGVLHTLIRCRFSPEFSTGQRFIYSGCSTGKIVSECLGCLGRLNER